MKEKGSIGIIESNDYISEMLKVLFQEEGFVVNAEYLLALKRDLGMYREFVSKYNPRVLLIDIPIPYEENWSFVQQLQNLPESQERGFVFLTSNKAKLEELVGETAAIELVGKPFDLDEILTAVNRASGLDQENS